MGTTGNRLQNAWRALGALALLTGAALVSTPATAQVSLYVQSAPPASHYEYVPASRHGYHWVPGHWQWNGYQHVWVHGHHLALRTGYAYSDPRWVNYGNRWGYVPGGWVQARHGGWDNGGHYGRGGRRDLDRDGIPNRYDRDIDGDGVPNRHDRRPLNPYRY